MVSCSCSRLIETKSMEITPPNQPQIDPGGPLGNPWGPPNRSQIDPGGTLGSPWDPRRPPGDPRARPGRSRGGSGRSRGAPGHPPGLPRGGPGASRGRPGTPRGHPGSQFGGDFRFFLDVASDFSRGSLGKRVRTDFRLIFGSFAQGPTLVSTRPQRCLLNVSTFAKKRASRLEEPRKTSKILPKST